MLRYLVTTFKEDELVNAFFDGGSVERRFGADLRNAHVPREQPACRQQIDDMIEGQYLTCFFDRKQDAELFCSLYAAKYPNWTYALAEISEVYISETPKVTKKQVNEKGVLPL